MKTNMNPFDTTVENKDTDAGVINKPAVNPFGELEKKVTAEKPTVALKKINKDPFTKEEYKDPLKDVRQSLKTVNASKMTEETISVIDWLASLLLMLLPGVNLVSALYFAFSKNSSDSKKNWAKANLILIAVGVTVTVIFYVLACTVWYSYFVSMY